MRIELTPRIRPSAWARAFAPVAAAFVLFLLAVLIVTFMGKSPGEVFNAYILYPLSDEWGIEQILLKASPLILIAIGLSYCARANLWNIGAEGQYTIGAIFGGWLAVTFYDNQSAFVLWPLMLIFGILGGALWGLIPAFLKTRFNVNEILSSLMLVYIAQQILDYLVRGPWRDPEGMNMPLSVIFSDNAIIPTIIPEGRVHYGLIFALLAVVVSSIIFSRTIFGYRLKLTGDAPKAARFAGYNNNRTTLIVFAISGGLAGLAGISEVSGTLNQLLPVISPGYGFTSIIVAFLGRLNPVGILFAGFFLALTFIGGENAQLMVKLPYDLTSMLQGLLLIFILAADALVSYRLRIIWRR